MYMCLSKFSPLREICSLISSLHLFCIDKRNRLDLILAVLLVLRVKIAFCTASTRQRVQYIGLHLYYKHKHTHTHTHADTYMHTCNHTLECTMLV